MISDQLFSLFSSHFGSFSIKSSKRSSTRIRRERSSYARSERVGEEKRRGGKSASATKAARFMWSGNDCNKFSPANDDDISTYLIIPSQMHNVERVRTRKHHSRKGQSVLHFRRALALVTIRIRSGTFRCLLNQISLILCAPLRPHWPPLRVFFEFRERNPIKRNEAAKKLIWPTRRSNLQIDYLPVETINNNKNE